MKEFPWLDERPIIVALAGPNGAGKTTFYHAYLKPAALRFLNADVLARALDLDPYAAARAADALRRTLLRIGESFVFETVFSDPVGDKLGLREEAVASGYYVVLLYIGLSGSQVSEQRVAMRVSQGGHDVPAGKLKSRYSRTLANLESAIRRLPHVLVFDNGDLSKPFRRVAVFERGRLVERASPLPRWFKPLLKR